MAKAQEALQRIAEFLSDELSLEEFEDWSASFVQTVFQGDDAEAKDIARLVRSRLNAFEDDANDEAMRDELARAILPFVVPPSSSVIELSAENSNIESRDYTYESNLRPVAA